MSGFSRTKAQLNHDDHGGSLLDRILAAPHLAHVVPRLQPEVLHRVIEQCGLQDCGPLVALATPGQLAQVFDLDLWRPAAPGLDEQFDAGRFGVWLEVMVEADVSAAAAMLAAMDVDLVAAGLARHVRVFDCAAVAPFVTLDGDLSPGRTFDDSLRCEVGGCVLVSRQTDVWDAITAVLTVMTDRHGPAFSRIMRACCRLSCSRPEIDGLDDLLTLNEQAMFDVSLDREVRRDTQGYVTPAEARAFLEAARRIDLRQGATPPGDPIARAHLARNEAAPESESAGASPEPPLHDRVGPMPDGAEAAIAAVVDLLHEAGVMPRAPRALLEAPQSSASRLALIRAHLQVAHDRDPDVYAARSAELAFLSNVIVAGTSIQARPLTREQASTAAVAVCNLGLENWPVHWQAGEDLLIRHDLVSAFQVGWTLLHEDVCMYAAEQLIAVLASLRCGDDDTHAALDELRVSLQRHWRAGNPCESREALDVIAILDMPSWAGLLGLIDELPTIHAAVGALLTGATRQIDPSAFEFISENAQIRQVHAFLALLPDTLRS